MLTLAHLLTPPKLVSEKHHRMTTPNNRNSDISLRRGLLPRKPVLVRLKVQPDNATQPVALELQVVSLGLPRSEIVGKSFGGLNLLADIAGKFGK